MTETIRAEEARIDVDGAPLVERLSFAAEGTRIALIGSWRALFALLAGRARLRSGRVLLSGIDATRAISDGMAGVAPLDPPLPREWSVERYLDSGARLAGFSRKETREQIRSVLATLALAHLQTRRISTLTLAEQRALSIAQALLGDPTLVLVEDPFGTLDERGTALVGEIVERAATARSLVLSSSVTPVSGPIRALIDRADRVVVLEAGAVVAQGAASEVLIAAPRYLVSVTRNREKLVDRLATLGVSVEASLDSVRFLVRLPDASATRAILDASLEADAPVLELRPLSFGAVAHEPPVGGSEASSA